ncbi:MAG TPA: TetR family transcriptional regulator [Paenibacillaceae bacterium]|nr:TetR family transcriptional regulator [Paenibacillaceae bacterium]
MSESKPLFDEAIQNLLESLKDEKDMTEKQQRIIASALEIIAEKGFNGSSTSEIAKNAGVAEGTIFRHFKTKKELLYALVGPMLIKFASPLIMKDVIRIIESEAPAEDVLQSLYENRLDLITENLPRVKILMQEALFHPEIMDSILNNLARQGRALGDNFVTERIESGEFRPLPTNGITRAIFSTLLGYFVFSQAFPEEKGEDDVEVIIDILLNGIKERHGD